MPLFRINGQLHYYAHVPKCGGSAVESYLRTRFGTLAFLNPQFHTMPPTQRWTRTSPQHLPWDAFVKLIPEGWMSSSFAVVRHPIARLVSAFHFQAEVERTVPPDLTIDEWFADWVTRVEDEPFLYDNHLGRQSAIVPPAATVFRLEDGLDAIIPYLDQLAGNADGARSIPLKNVRKRRSNPKSKREQLSAETLARAAAYYSEDFQRFGYTETASTTLPASRSSARRGLFGIFRSGWS